MAYTLGRIGIVVYDTYDSNKQYEALDMVPYNGGSYVAKATPPKGTVPTNTAYWVKLTQSQLVDSVVTAGSTNAVSGNGVYSHVNSQIDSAITAALGRSY